MKVQLDSIRRAWKNAKNDFYNSYGFHKMDAQYVEQYWKDFGDEYKMKVIINQYIRGIPKIDEVDFTDEKDYVWFMMRWA